MAVFQSDGLFTNTSHMRYDRTPFTRDLTNLTQCLRVKLQHLRGVHSVVLGYAIEDDDRVLKTSEGKSNFKMF